jgi:hypothetical protein
LCWWLRHHCYIILYYIILYYIILYYIILYYIILYYIILYYIILYYIMLYYIVLYPCSIIFSILSIHWTVPNTTGNTTGCDRGCAWLWLWLWWLWLRHLQLFQFTATNKKVNLQYVIIISPLISKWHIYVWMIWYFFKFICSYYVRSRIYMHIALYIVKLI